MFSTVPPGVTKHSLPLLLPHDEVLLHWSYNLLRNALKMYLVWMSWVILQRGAGNATRCIFPLIALAMRVCSFASGDEGLSVSN